MGRVAEAWRALRGHTQPCKTCLEHVREIQREWVEWEMTLSDLLAKMRAQYARTSKIEKARLEAMAEEAEETPPQNGPQPASRGELWNVARSRGLV